MTQAAPAGYVPKPGEVSLKVLNSKFKGGTASQRYTADTNVIDSSETFKTHVSVEFSVLTDKPKRGFARIKKFHVSFKNANWDCKVWFKAAGSPGHFTFDNLTGDATATMKSKAIAMIKKVVVPLNCKYG